MKAKAMRDSAIILAIFVLGACGSGGGTATGGTTETASVQQTTEEKTEPAADAASDVPAGTTAGATAEASADAEVTATDTGGSDAEAQTAVEEDTAAQSAEITEAGASESDAACQGETEVQDTSQETEQMAVVRPSDAKTMVEQAIMAIMIDLETTPNKWKYEEQEDGTIALGIGFDSTTWVGSKETATKTTALYFLYDPATDMITPIEGSQEPIAMTVFDEAIAEWHQRICEMMSESLGRDVSTADVQMEFDRMGYTHTNQIQCTWNCHAVIDGKEYKFYMAADGTKQTVLQNGSIDNEPFLSQGETRSLY
ncbi:MAG: hypothetical protein IJP92_08290 [Lachnospiraceae bacterium]|nr:hypothetical protein [Lachnospiraceae bacterium]